MIFTVTHPFHPLTGQRFNALLHRKWWDEPRVSYRDPDTSQLRSLPLSWTDLAPADPFRLVAGNRTLLRLTDLRALAALVHALRAAHGLEYPARQDQMAEQE